MNGTKALSFLNILALNLKAVQSLQTTSVSLNLVTLPAYVVFNIGKQASCRVLGCLELQLAPSQAVQAGAYGSCSQ